MDRERESVCVCVCVWERVEEIVPVVFADINLTSGQVNPATKQRQMKTTILCKK